MSNVVYNDLSKESRDTELVSSQAGVSLAEIVMSLAVIGIIIAAAVGVFQLAFGTSKSRTENQNIQGLISGISNLYGATRDYTAGDLTPTIIAQKAAPAGIISGGMLRNSWGGAITVTGSGGYYSITDSGVPKRACVELATMAVEMQQLSVNGTQAGPGSAMSVATATTACNQENTNTLVWQMR